MNYDQTIDYLYSRLPMFTRIGAAAFKKDLTNTIILCAELGEPQHKFKSIHVGGTNGKGSTSHMIASILQEQGYKTGLYTSPHLKDFRERIRINGKMISKTQVVQFIKKNKKTIEKIEPSFFEATVAMAFDYFAKEKVDVAVIEVGLGGRLDSTNIIQPEISVITNISLDHTNMLGNTLEEIAFEKAGIIKKNTPVVIGETQENSKTVFLRKAEEMNAPIIFADQDLKVSNIQLKNSFLTLNASLENGTKELSIKSDLTGLYQPKNITTVLETIKILNDKNIFSISDENILAGLKKVKINTKLMGRWQTINKKPLTICDTGHNEAGISEVIKNIESIKYKNLHIVFGMVKDKDITKVLALLPKNATYYFCQPNLERALNAQELKNQAASFNLIGNCYKSVTEAKQMAQNIAKEDDLIYIGGSTFVVAEAI